MYCSSAVHFQCLLYSPTRSEIDIYQTVQNNRPPIRGSGYFSSESENPKMSGGANFVQGALIFPKSQIAKNSRGGYLMWKILGASRPILVISPLKIRKIFIFLLPKYHIFRRFAPKMLGGANFSQGALIFQEFSKFENFGGALVLSEHSPEMAGVR